MLWRVLLIICIAAAVADDVRIYSLNSDNLESRWTVTSENGSIKVNAQVPGGIYSDLEVGGIIPDVYYEYNDVHTRWVSYTSWIYSRTFELSKEILDKNRIDLVFHGLDTVAHITVNGHPVGSTDNMFVRYKFNVKDYLKEGTNEISILFDSPVEVAANLSSQEMIPPSCVPPVYRGECHVNQLRKMQASFSWDWGPALPSVGIWKPLYLQPYNNGIIVDTLVTTAYVESDNKWNVGVTVYMDLAQKEGGEYGTLNAVLKVRDNSTVTESMVILTEQQEGLSIRRQLNFSIFDAQVDRWWPNGYGQQNLYQLTVSLQSEGGDENSSKGVKIGFRTIEVVQEPYDEGLTFYFRVNGHPIFMKGSNWIPGRILPEHGYDENIVTETLQAASAVHMNMLRVWGGGLYESDLFYEKCDELGLLIWQDMMFACNMYPANRYFLSSVSTEIEQNIRRLQHHPSIAIWAGNNENELALRDNWYGTGHDFEHYKQEYIDLYVDTVRPVIQSNDPSRVNIISSPSNGIESEHEGFVANKPGDPKYGDTHYYNYLQNLWSMDTYPKSRFCSEYGFQSIPSIETMLTATADINNLEIGSDFMNHREHSDFNNYSSMKIQIAYQFGELDSSDPNHFREFQFYSQIIQAWTYKTETEFYRQSREDWMTMGALYWQLNDVWQAPTWSSIEFGGHWKMAHYYAKDFFSPILISPRLLPTGEITVHLISDRLVLVQGANMTIDTFRWDSLVPIYSDARQVNLPPLSATKLDSGIELPSQDERKKIYYRFSLKDKDGNLLSPYNYIFPVALKHIEGFSTPSIAVKFINNTNPDIYDVEVTTNSVGLFVWLELGHEFGYFSENGFILTETVKKLQFYAKAKTDGDTLLTKVNLKMYNPRNFNTGTCAGDVDHSGDWETQQI